MVSASAACVQKQSCTPAPHAVTGLGQNMVMNADVRKDPAFRIVVLRESIKFSAFSPLAVQVCMPDTQML